MLKRGAIWLHNLHLSEVNCHCKIEFYDFLYSFQSKIQSPLAPLLAPLLNFQKVWNLSFRWKKIKVITWLDNFLAHLENLSCHIVENRDFQLYDLKHAKFCFFMQISILAKNRTKIAMTLIFFSSESWDSILFENLKGGPKGGPGEAVFCSEKSSKSRKFQNLSLIPIQNSASPGPPFKFSKSMESQLSLEKN